MKIIAQVDQLTSRCRAVSLESESFIDECFLKKLVSNICNHFKEKERKEEEDE